MKEHKQADNAQLIRREFLGKYKDVVCPIILRTTGAGRPSLVTFLGNMRALEFEVNDQQDLECIEIPHEYELGSEIEVHVHWATSGDNNGTERGVKWELELSYTKNGVFITPITSSQETLIAPNEVAKTSKYTSLLRFTPDIDNVGNQIIMSIKRIASTAPAPADDPVILQIGIHVKVDGLGSNFLNRKK